ncbi:MAG: hypothetical protein PUE65_07985 [Mollicutes bacterium]|nr:hypothetical protein [Mollicutes bacterium]
MSLEDFINFLKDWVSRINDLNRSKTENKIILDEDYFTNDKGRYEVNEGAIEAWKESKILFIGDNPGKRERKNEHYFFFDSKNAAMSEYRTAGYKYHNFLKILGVDECEGVKFNKCLISTDSTKELKKEQIDDCSFLVCSFIRFFHKYSPNTFILFSGIAGIENGKSKFELLYKELKDIIDQDYVGFMGHITRRKFPKDICSLEINNLEDLKIISRKYKESLFPKEKSNTNVSIDTCKNCPFKSYCKDKGDDGDLESSPVKS